MADHSELFRDCKAYLENPPAAQGGDAQVKQLLNALGYQPHHGQALEVTANRCCLLELAARLDDVFQLPMQHAPGVCFFGAMMSPQSFGASGHGELPVGAAGRGVALQQAFESCMGEAAEFLSFLERRDDPLIGVARADDGLTLDERAWARSAMGFDGQEAPEKIDRVEARSLVDGRTVWLPAELVLRRPQEMRRARRQAESNGTGAGLTFNDAVLSGLMEVVERDAIALWWFGGEPAGALHPDIEHDAGFAEFVRTSRGDGERKTWFLDISTEFDIPVVVALSSEPDGRSVVAGFAADPDPTTAAQKAFLEMCQMELAQEISLHKLERHGQDALSPQDRIWIERHKSMSVENFPRLRLRAREYRHHVALRSDPYAAAIEAIERAGFTVLAADITRPEINVPVARVVVPGLQSATTDWISKRLRVIADCHGVDLDQLKHCLAPI